MTEKTVAAKLQIKPDYAVYFVGLDSAQQLVGELPAGARIVTAPGDADAAILFVADGAELDQRLTENLPSLPAAKAVWICYPKGNKTDINRDSIWPRLTAHDWRLVSNVSIDDTWSALRAKQLDA
jgi:6-phosphogluconate dehydrogenase (decarboxylating)